jgi:mRNA interferase MazF
MPERGEVWLADLGWAAKTRPVLILSVPYSDSDYALLAAVPHTTATRGSGFEVAIEIRGLRPGAFNVQGTLAVPPHKCIQKLAKLTPGQLRAVETAVARWLGIVP